MAIYSSARHRIGTEIDTDAFEMLESTVGTGSVALADSPDAGHSRKQCLRLRSANKTAGTSDEARVRFRPYLRETSEYTIKPGSGALGAYWLSTRASRSGAITAGTNHQIFEGRNQADTVSRCRVLINEFGEFVLGVNDNATQTPASSESVNDDEVFELILYYQPTSGADDGEARLYLVQSGNWVEVCTITGHDQGGVWFADWYSKIGPGGAADGSYDYDLNLIEVGFSAVSRAEVEEPLPWDARCLVEYPTQTSAVVQVHLDPREYKNATHAQVRVSPTGQPGPGSQRTEWVALQQVDETVGAEEAPITRIEVKGLQPGLRHTLDILVGDGTGAVALQSRVFAFKTFKELGDTSSGVYAVGGCIDQYSGPQLGLKALAEEPAKIGLPVDLIILQGDNGEYEGTIVHTRLGFAASDNWRHHHAYQVVFRSDPGWLALQTTAAFCVQTDDHPFNDFHAGHALDGALLSTLNSRWAGSTKTIAEMYRETNRYFDQAWRGGQPNRPTPGARYWSMIDGCVRHIFLDTRDGDHSQSKAFSDAQVAWYKRLIDETPPGVLVDMEYWQGAAVAELAQADSPAVVAAAQVTELVNYRTANAPDWLRAVMLQNDTHALLLGVLTTLPAGVTDPRGMIAGSIMACPMGTVLLSDEPDLSGIVGDIIFKTEHGAGAGADDPQHATLNGSGGGFSNSDLVRSTGAVVKVDVMRGRLEIHSWRIDKDGTPTHVNGGNAIVLPLNLTRTPGEVEVAGTVAADITRVGGVAVQDDGAGRVEAVVSGSTALLGTINDAGATVTSFKVAGITLAVGELKRSAVGVVVGGVKQRPRRVKSDTDAGGGDRLIVVEPALPGVPDNGSVVEFPDSILI